MKELFHANYLAALNYKRSLHTTQGIAEGMRSIVMNEIRVWVVDFFVPVLTIVGLAFFIFQVFGLIKIRQHGDPAGEFMGKAGFALITLIISISLGAIWRLFASYLQ